MVNASRSDTAEKLCGRSTWRSVFMSVLILYTLMFFALRLAQVNYSILPFQFLWTNENENVVDDDVQTTTPTTPSCNNNNDNNDNNSPTTTPTNMSHLFFAIAGSANTWDTRQFYVRQWWKQKTNRGYVWLDKAPNLNSYIWSSTTPPYKLYGDTNSKVKGYTNFGHPFTVRIMRVLLEAYNIMELDYDGIRWFVMVDDDTVVFADNLVDALGQYDHRGYHYIGGTSECVWQNGMHSFNMAYGGAGYAVSYPLVKAMARILEGCLGRYQNVYGSNQVTEACMRDLGVSLTKLPGFHQFDLLGDISGLLSAHPQAPLLTFHHLDNLDPIFPYLDRHDSLRHLMKAAAVDSSRLLQQSVCYHSTKNWSISISWGYTVHIYESIQTPFLLQTPAVTFRPWNDKWNEPNTFMFNVRPPMDDDPCMAPHVFYFDSARMVTVKYNGGGSNMHVVSVYKRRKARGLGACGDNGVGGSANFVTKVQVLSPPTRQQWGNGRRECSEIIDIKGNTAKIMLRPCMDTEALNEAILFRDD